jgi:hypothetical protein
MDCILTTSKGTTMYEQMWKKDWSDDRARDAELFIKEAFVDVKVPEASQNKTASSSSIRNKLIAGAATIGGLGMAGREYFKGRKLPSGVTEREAQRLANQAQNEKYEELTGNSRSRIVKAVENAKDALGQKMDENRAIAVPAKGLIGATIGGVSAKKTLDAIKRNARYI